MRRLTPLQAAFPWLLALLLLGMRLPSLLQAVGTNSAAISEARLCTGPAQSPGADPTKQIPAPLASAIGPTQASWFQFVGARCKGDTESARSAARALFAGSDDRLSVIRSSYPDDLIIAGYAEAAYPDEPDAHFWLADALSAAGETEAAINEYEKGLALNGTQAEDWLALGDLYKVQNNLAEAVRAYDQACKYRDTGSNGCEQAGAIYLETKQYRLAADRYRASISQINHVWLPSELGLSNALIALGDMQEAVPHLRILAENGSVSARQLLRQFGEPVK